MSQPQAASQARRRSMQAEQAYLTALYERLDAARALAAETLREAEARGGGGGYAGLLERQTVVDEQARIAQRLAAVEEGLCFGRIDHRDLPGTPGGPLYVGRIGLRDAEHEVMLVDWRAPAARPFYAATPQAPAGLVRRRHLHTRGRTVVGLDDEVFDLDGLDEEQRSGLAGEAALLAALRAGRTGRMHDIVSTIQGEQDRVIRSGLHGILVVQGGPGTGKTVAALHRAAYLLYTYRSVLERRGVLVVGPNATFLRYISQVLPSLGETDVVLTTVGGLFPGVRAEARDAPEAAVVKGSLRMAGLVAAAVRERQRVPRGGLRVEAQGMELTVDEQTCRDIRDLTRDLGIRHNAARPFFVREMLGALALDQQRRFEESVREAEEDAGLTGGAVPELEDPDAPLWTEEDTEVAVETLWGDPAVQRALNALWPHLAPERLVGELLSDPGLMSAAAREAAREPEEGAVAEHEWRILLRPAGSAWTVDDVPLLDEAAELLGEEAGKRSAEQRAAERRRRERERYARGVLEISGLFEGDREGAAAALAERQADEGPAPTTAERAEADRSWAYGHVIVDEAQELSEMAWRTVMRRIPTRSLTVVGDTAQTGSAAGASSWEQMLGGYAGGRLHEERLLVNYRTPAEIMDVAADVLKEVAPDQRPPESVREGGERPRAVRIAPGTWAERLPGLVGAELRAVGAAPDGADCADGADPGGRVAVIVPDDRHAEFAALLPEAASDASPAVLDSPVAVLTCTLAKGLEFDSVLIAEPDRILAGSPQGGRDLYVAVTRATRRMTVLHERPLPGMLSGLARGD
ncbi:DNA helicase IV [Nocardiopsis composta]|uniref:DNA helicase IV n=2 Tax=Nocardiopsis composta TaxID=157465 RepID=A0A7W8VHE2_9ACTN|nr:ATP-binding domain-containing protein [Nocardiopsis composta]MBB5435939.1 DNA helicase IV [Nocardiopsis composta]